MESKKFKMVFGRAECVYYNVGMTQDYLLNELSDRKNKLNRLNSLAIC